MRRSTEGRIIKSSSGLPAPIPGGLVDLLPQSSLPALSLFFPQPPTPISTSWKPAGHTGQGIRQEIFTLLPLLQLQSPSLIPTSNRLPAVSSPSSWSPFPDPSSEPGGTLSFSPSWGPSQHCLLILIILHFLMLAPKISKHILPRTCSGHTLQNLRSIPYSNIKAPHSPKNQIGQQKPSNGTPTQ